MHAFVFVCILTGICFGPKEKTPLYLSCYSLLAVVVALVENQNKIHVKFN